MYTEDQLYEKQDFRLQSLELGEYDNCRFIHCDFSGSSLSGQRFSDCVFEGCNLALVSLAGTSFRDVQFKECKMIGLQFMDCNEYGVGFSFHHCTLDHSSFFKMKIKKTVFRHCQLHDTDFSEADLTAAVFEHCDLAHARFDQTCLEKADLRTAFNYTIDPEINRIKKATFSLPAVTGLLARYDIEIDGMK